MRAAAILLCAGRGERLGRGEDKALTVLGGRAMFTWSLEALQRSAAIEAIVVVGDAARLKPALLAAGLTEARIVAWTPGGRERQDSVARGLAALPPEVELVAVHDSARALVTPELIGRVVADAAAHGAAIAAVALEDTLKRGTLGAIEQTVSRAGLWRAQTPQAFRRDWLERAHAEAHGVATDDAALVEALGLRVRLTEGDPMNFKITRPRDLELAEACLAARRAEA
jgi:2-C-methyl-D-erythritol 4-phosphate cytidylyltransferase